MLASVVGSSWITSWPVGSVEVPDHLPDVLLPHDENPLYCIPLLTSTFSYTCFDALAFLPPLGPLRVLYMILPTVWWYKDHDRMQFSWFFLRALPLD